MRKLLINRKYLHRHKILGALQIKLDEGGRPDAMPEDIELSYRMLIEKSGLTEQEVLKQLDHLSQEDEINIEERNFNLCYLILRKGTIAYHDAKYLNLGWKSFIDSAYDIGKTISVFFLLILAIATFLSNRFEMKQNKKEMEQMKVDIKNIRDSSNKSHR